MSLVLAALLAAVPSVLPLRALHGLGARDRVTGIYESGDQRLLVLPTGRNSYVMRHVTADCDELAQVGLHLSGGFARAGADTPFVRSEGPSFVLLPDAGKGCSERAEEIRFARRQGPLTCQVASDHARPLSLAREPFVLARGARVEVLPWAPDRRQVLVRSGDRIGTLQARDLECSARGLSSLSDALFETVEPTRRVR